MNIDDVVAAARMAEIEVTYTKRYVTLLFMWAGHVRTVRLQRFNRRYMLEYVGPSLITAAKPNLRDCVTGKTRARAALAVVQWIIEQRERGKQ